MAIDEASRIGFVADLTGKTTGFLDRDDWSNTVKAGKHSSASLDKDEKMNSRVNYTKSKVYWIAHN